MLKLKMMKRRKRKMDELDRIIEKFIEELKEEEKKEGEE